MSNDPEYDLVKLSCLLVVVIFLILLCAIPISCASGCLNYGKKVLDRVASPDAIITNYEWYEQQVKDIKAIEGQIADSKEAVNQYKKDHGTVSNYNMSETQEFDRLNAELTGLKQARRKMIQDYNARSSMITRKLWKSSSLPYQIEE